MPDPLHRRPLPATLRFGSFTLLTQARQLLADGVTVPLGARAFDLLLVLVERPGELVTKAELLDRVWAGLVVEENNVAAQMVALRKALGGQHIATVPGRGYCFTGTLQAEGGAPPTAAPTASWVPGPQLFGRGRDLQQLRNALEDPGCVTVVGPGGVGKTALARSLCEALAGGRAFIWVNLADLEANSILLPALGRALGLNALPEAEAEATAAIAQAVGAQRLLVLDNAEHLLPGVQRLCQGLLWGAPGLHLLVTSQAPLGLHAERVLTLAPLQSDTPGLGPEAALHEGAVGLLVARVLGADYRQRIGAEQLPLLRALCTGLDGLPLALEMAAARVPLLGLQGVHDALQDRLSLLARGPAGAPARQRSLQATLDWSHGLLQPQEQALLHTLGVFVGGFTLDLLAQMMRPADGGRWALIDRLSVLVERSLLVTDGGSPPRYRLLETVRSYALQQLVATGEAHAVRNRHAWAMGVLLQQALTERATGVPDERQPTVLLALAEMANVRAALQHTLQQPSPQALQLSMDAAELTIFSPWRAETYTWMQACEPLLDGPLADVLEPRLRAAWLRAMARQLLFRQQPRAAVLARQSCALYAAAGDADEHLRSLVALVRSHYEPGPGLDAALAELQAAQASRADPHGALAGDLALLATGALAYALSVRGDREEALQQMLQEAALARSLGRQAVAAAAQSRAIAQLYELARHDEVVAQSRALLAERPGAADATAAYVHTYLLTSLCDLGRVAEAQALAPEVLTLCQRLQVTFGHYCVARVPALQGRPRAAALLLGHADQATEAAAARVADSLYAATLDAVRAALGGPTLQRLRAEGRQLDSAAAEQLLRSGTEAD